MAQFTQPKLSTLRAYDCEKLKERYSNLKGMTEVRAPSALAIEIQNALKIIREKECGRVGIPHKAPKRAIVKVKPYIKPPYKPPPTIVKRETVKPVPVYSGYRYGDCRYGNHPMKAEITVNDNFVVSSNISNGLKRSMQKNCSDVFHKYDFIRAGSAVGSGNICVAEQVMRFKKIVEQNAACINTPVKVEFTPKAKEIWAKNNKEMNEKNKEYYELKKAYDKGAGFKPPSKAGIIMFSETQKKNMSKIEGKEPLLK